MRVYPRHRLDLSLGHLAYAGLGCALPFQVGRLETSILSHAGEPGIVCASVRSGFELLLDALALPPGSEILVSAITHPDMVRIVERHDLRAIPVDVDAETLAPRLDALAESVTNRTRAILVAHLFGSRVDLEPVLAFARAHDLIAIEDCAQSLRGPGDSGDPRATVAMFSFGSIKTCPALGGAILYVRDEAVLDRMAAIHALWPRQTRRTYFARVLRFVGLLCLGVPAVFGLFSRLAAAFGVDIETVVNASVHAVRPPAASDEARFAAWLRRRPSVPLLALLERRLRTFDSNRLRRRAEVGEEIAERLPPTLSQPGRSAPVRTHWVFPVGADDPAELVKTLRRAGFDATSRTTSITAVDGRDGTRARSAHELMARVVFLPVYPELPPRARQKLVATLDAYGDHESG